MILTCPDCATSYFVDDDRVPPAGRTVKCTSCGSRWRALPEGAATPEPAPAPTPQPAAPSAVAEPPPAAPADDLEFVAAPVTPRRETPVKPPRRRLPLIVGGAVLALLAGLVATAVVFRQQIAGMVPGTAPVFTAVGLPVNTLGLVVEGVAYKAVLEAGRPVLAVTGAIRNVRKEAIEAPSVRMSLKDREGEVVADYLVQTLSAQVPAGGVRYFAISLPNPPANSHELEIGFDLGTKATVHPTPGASLAAHAEPAEAKPLPAGSPDALETHEQH